MLRKREVEAEKGQVEEKEKGKGKGKKEEEKQEKGKGRREQGKEGERILVWSTGKTINSEYCRTQTMVCTYIFPLKATNQRTRDQEMANSRSGAENV